MNRAQEETRMVVIAILFFSIVSSLIGGLFSLLEGDGFWDPTIEFLTNIKDIVTALVYLVILYGVIRLIAIIFRLQ